MFTNPTFIEFVENFFKTSNPIEIAEIIFYRIVLITLIYSILWIWIKQEKSRQEFLNPKTKSECRERIASLQVSLAEVRAMPVTVVNDYNHPVVYRRKSQADRRNSKAKRIAKIQSDIAILRAKMAELPNDNNENDKTITTINY